MYNSNYNPQNFEADGCASKGSCALSPDIASLQEVIFYLINLTANYVIKLKDFSLINDEINFKIIDIFASLLYVSEYSEKQMFEIVQNAYSMYSASKLRYQSACAEKNIKNTKINEILEVNANSSLSQVIYFGNKIITNSYTLYSDDIRNFLQIQNVVLKSICKNISELFDFGIQDKKSISIVVGIISDFKNLCLDKIKNNISKLSDINSKLQSDLANALLGQYGDISEVLVSHSTRKGKCILVSGSNFNDLEKILELTKNQNIDVYTHSNLLISHSLNKFKNYPNLRGHYGRNSENCIVDYGTFPGAILLTKNSKNNTEFLYRGKIFSNDYITPIGVIPVKNNDYSELIKCANESKGFKNGRQMPDSNLGFNQSDIDKLIERIIQRFTMNKLSRLFIVGINSFSEIQKEYFKQFFSKLKYDEFSISFYYESDKNNVETINIGNYVPLANFILSKLLKNNQYIDKIHFLFPVCDSSAISSIIRLKNIGANNLCISACSAKVVNPSVFGKFCDYYGVKILSNPSDDLKQIRKNTSQ